MKSISIALTFIVSVTATQTIAADYIDWRKTGNDQQKLSNIIKALPGTSIHMFQVGQRYRNLYWAGKMQKWAFADYQIEEIQGLLKTVGITRPKRKKTADIFLAKAFNLFPAAIRNKNQQQFLKAFETMRKECLNCHAANDHSFITLPSAPNKATSLVLE